MSVTLAAPRIEIVTPQTIAEIPAVSDQFVDVAILDMNHGFANLGHEAIVAAIASLAAEFHGALDAQGRRVRVVSLPVRDRHVVPSPGRFGLLIGTGGPGHIDPARNRVEAEDTIVEDGAWEEPFFAFMDAIRDDGETALIGICHTHGILCRWAKIAEPMLRDAVMGGKSVGLRTTVLTDAALEHPWFAQMSRALGGRVFPVVDSRYYDLVPTTTAFPAGMTPIGFEANAEGKPARGLTMVEFARSGDGRVPRILGVNHHPEVASAGDLEAILQRKLAAGEIDEATYRSRYGIIAELRRPDHSEDARLIGTAYTYTKILRYYLERMIAR